MLESSMKLSLHMLTEVILYVSSAEVVFVSS